MGWIVQVYSTPKCTFCTQAKTLLKMKGIPFEEIEVNVGQMLLEDKSYIEPTEFKIRFPGVTGVPLIVINGRRLGGFNELREWIADSEKQKQVLLG